MKFLWGIIHEFKDLVINWRRLCGGVFLLFKRARKRMMVSEKWWAYFGMYSARDKPNLFKDAHFFCLHTWWMYLTALQLAQGDRRGFTKRWSHFNTEYAKHSVSIDNISFLIFCILIWEQIRELLSLTALFVPQFSTIVIV